MTLRVTLKAKIQRIFQRIIAHRMRRDWNKRATENPLHFVATGKQDWNEEDFFQSGRLTIERYILNDMTNISQGVDPRKMRVLEVGCGVGRVLNALAEVFGEVVGVDVSGEMVLLARHFLSSVPNVKVYQNKRWDLRDLRDNSFDFAFSTLVFPAHSERGHRGELCEGGRSRH